MNRSHLALVLSLALVSCAALLAGCPEEKKADAVTDAGLTPTVTPPASAASTAAVPTTPPTPTPVASVAPAAVDAGPVTDGGKSTDAGKPGAKK